MKILKKGNIPVKTIRWYQLTCTKCATEFTFNENDKDVMIEQEKCLNGRSSFTLKCPLCEHEISGDLKTLAHADLLEDEEPSVNTLFTMTIPNRPVAPYSSENYYRIK